MSKTLCYIPYDPAARNIPFSGKLKATNGVFVISVTLFLTSIVINGGHFQPLVENPMLGPSLETILKMGGMNQSLVRGNHEWWRIVWAAFLHAGLIHLVLNLVVWIAIGCILEPDWGAWRTAAVFFFSAMTGNLLSVALDPLNISVGTSGGIYGAMAALNIYVLEYWTTIHKPKSTILIIIGTTLLSLATSFVPYIDTYAHLGGIVGGFLVSLSTLKKLESIAEPRRIVVPRTKILLETQVTNSSLNIEERTPFKGRLSAEETIMPTQLTEVVCLQNRTPGSRRGVVDQSPEKTLRLKSSGWTIPKQPTHFLYHPEVTMLSSPYTTNDFSPCKMVINPSAHRPSLRRTRETNFRVKSHHTSSLWVIRGISAGLLIGGWMSLLFLLFICPGCYNPPGQILQIKELRNARNLVAVDLKNARNLVGMDLKNGRNLVGMDPKILI